MVFIKFYTEVLNLKMKPFKNVAKYFDAADSDKDGTLSREEFDNALNGARPQ